MPAENLHIHSKNIDKISVCHSVSNQLIGQKSIRFFWQLRYPLERTAALIQQARYAN